MNLEDIIVNVPIINALQNAEIVEERRDQNIRYNRRIRDQDDPFELPNKKFMQLYRLSKAAARYVIDIVEPHMTPQTRISAISPTTKIITALRFFASGSYQMDIGKNIYMDVSQPTVSRSIHEVIDISN